MYDEAALIERMKQKDDKAFEEIFNHYQKLIFVIVNQIVKNEDDTKEIVDDAFLSAYNNISSHNSNSSFKYWLITIAKNFAYKKIDEYQKTRTGLDNLLKDLEYSNNQVELPELGDALKKLTEQERLIFTYHVIYGLTYTEIGAIIDKGKSTVHREYVAILKKIRDNL